jgi:hypothetical protein
VGKPTLVPVTADGERAQLPAAEPRDGQESRGGPVAAREDSQNRGAGLRMPSNCGASGSAAESPACTGARREAEALAPAPPAAARRRPTAPRGLPAGLDPLARAVDTSPRETRAARNGQTSPPTASRSLPGKKSQPVRWPQGVAPGFLYAREPDWDSGGGEGPSAEEGLIATQLVKISAEADERDLVFGDAAFQIHVVGLRAAHGEGASGGLARLGLGNASSVGQRQRVLYSTRRGPAEGVNALLPAVHYDSIRRESLNNRSKDYFAIAGDRGLVTRGSGGSCETLTLGLRFALFQIQDELQTRSVRTTLDSVDALNGALDSLGSAPAPYFSRLAPFIRVSGALGAAALEQAGCANRVVDADVTFRLVSRDPRRNPRGEVYLRYGYYFLLSDPTASRLFTNLGAVEHIRLFARRETDGNILHQSTKGLSYIVLRVSRQVRASAAPSAGAAPRSPARVVRQVSPPSQEAAQDVDVLSTRAARRPRGA